MSRSAPRMGARCLASLAGCLIVASPAVASYMATPIATLGGPTARGSALNDSGSVVGASAPNATAPCHPFRAEGPSIQDLDPGFFRGGGALGISNTGHVAGFVAGDLHANSLATLDGSVIAGLGSESRASGVNDAGLAVGQALNSETGLLQPFVAQAVTAANGQAGFRWAYLSGTDGVPILGGASAVNDAGQVVGTLGNGHAFLFDPATNGMGQGTIVDLGALAALRGGRSAALAINEDGRVIGTYDDGATTRGFLYGGGAVTFLPLIPDGINGAGQVVGMGFDPASSTTRPYLFSGGVLTDLSGLDLGPGVRLTGLPGINDSGQILANGFKTDPTGLTAPIEESFLLTPARREMSLLVVRPIPEPASLTLLVLGGLALLASRRRRPT